jgi:mono/diheme cytochrome c family protein
VIVVTGLLVGAAGLTGMALADDMIEPVGRWVVRGVGTVLVPAAGAVLLLQLAVMGLLRRGVLRKMVFGLGTAVLAVLLGGAGSLLYGALSDRLPPEGVERAAAEMRPEDKEVPESAKKFQHEQEEADKAAARAVNLAANGIPASGAIDLLRRDPRTQGKRLFKEHCATCHNHGDDFKDTKDRKASAGDLAGFGTEAYNLRLLTHPGHKDFFGRTMPKRTKMQEAVEKAFPALHVTAEDEARMDAQEKKALAEDRVKDREELRLIAGWLARHPRHTSPDRDSDEFKLGHKAYLTRDCATCHAYEGKGGRQGPDLTGYGDADWVRLMIMAPASPKRYGPTNTMPAFRDLEGPAGAVVQEEMNRIKDMLLGQISAGSRRAEQQRVSIEFAHRVVHLSDLDRELIIRWLLKDDRPVFGGEPISNAR